MEKIEMSLAIEKVDNNIIKETTRELTKEEIDKYNKMSIRINSGPAIPLKIG